eukprot:8159394-Pyramimonas_sp.AAC.1
MAGMSSLGAFDLKTGWDLDDPVVRMEVESIVEHEKPWLVLMSPPCRMLSILQNLTACPRDPVKWIRDYKRAIGY